MKSPHPKFFFANSTSSHRGILWILSCTLFPIQSFFLYIFTLWLKKKSLLFVPKKRGYRGYHFQLFSLPLEFIKGIYYKCIKVRKLELILLPNLLSIKEIESTRAGVMAHWVTYILGTWWPQAQPKLLTPLVQHNISFPHNKETSSFPVSYSALLCACMDTGIYSHV